MNWKEHAVDLVDGKFKGTSAADLDGLFRRLGGDQDRKNLVVHFHGGLVSRRSARTAATDLYRTYRNGSAYPVFFIWNSDLVNTLVRNLDEIAQEKAFQRLVRKLGQFLVGKLAEAAGARGGRVTEPRLMEVPEDLLELEEFLSTKEAGKRFRDPTLGAAQEDQLQRDLRRDRVLREAAAEIAAGVRTADEIGADDRARSRSRGRKPVRSTEASLMSKHVLEEIEAEAPRPSARGATTILVLARYGVKIGSAVLDRYRRKRDHGLYTTIVEETLRALYLDNVGALVWELMKGDTADAFGGDPALHGGTGFVHRLKENWQPRQRVTLVGHSTGAIFIGHFLEEVDRLLPAWAKFDVVYMAPACTFRFLHDRLDLFNRRVRNIRSFGLSDELERGYFEVPVLYKGSLLYLVSGVLEQDEADMPLVGMERYHKAGRPYDQKYMREVRDYLGTERLWSVVHGGPGRNSAAQQHGGFDREAVTKQSQEHILSRGF